MTTVAARQLLKFSPTTQVAVITDVRNGLARIGGFDDLKEPEKTAVKKLFGKDFSEDFLSDGTRVSIDLTPYLKGELKSKYDQLIKLGAEVNAGLKLANAPAKYQPYTRGWDWVANKPKSNGKRSK